MPFARPFLRCAAAALLLAAGLSHAQETRPGLWEFKTEMKYPGQPDLEAQMAEMREQLANLPPEVREMLEKQMASAGISMGEGGTIRMCITPEEARTEPVYEGYEEDGCVYTEVKSSRNTWRGNVSCSNPPSKGTFETVLHSRDHYTTRSTLKSEEGVVEMRVEARRIGADCGALGRS